MAESHLTNPSLTLAIALGCAAVAGLAGGPTLAAPAAGYVAPRTAEGQPDIGGYWSSSTLTPMTRDFKLGDRLAYTPAEARALEADEVAQAAAGDKPTDPNARVTDLPTNEASQHVVRAVVSLAHGFGQQTVAEGVEDAETLEILRGFGVDFAQGYFFARPGPLAAVPVTWAGRGGPA